MMIREYDPWDSDRLYEISLSSLDQLYREEMFTFFYTQWPKGQIVACDYSGRPVGFLSSTKTDTFSARIVMLAVDRSHRSLGLGSKLITELKRISMMNGIYNISLEVRISNTRAMNFYRRHGFVPTEFLRNYYDDGGDALRMNTIIQLNI